MKRTKGPAPNPPHADERARAAAILVVVVVSMVITMVIVAGIHLLRANGLLVPGAM